MGFFSVYPGNNRIFGLDLLRFLAIFFVLLGHSAILMPMGYKHWPRTLVLDGVGLFFVLSGFLIGQILLRQINAGKAGLRDLLRFWSRRWLRTLPAYLFMLLLLLWFAFSYRPDFIPEKWYKYFLFLQNFNQVQPAFFQESWSLSIEEWFYLLVPVLFFVTYFLFKKQFRNAVLAVIVAVILGIVVYRYFLFSSYQGKDFQTDILLQVIPRLDGIMVGVLGAFWITYYPNSWQRLNHWAWFPAMITMLFVLKYLNKTDASLYYCVFAPTLKALCVLLTLPFLSNWRIKGSNLPARFITFVSITSYSIYLINRSLVIDILIKFGLHGELAQKHKAGPLWGLEYFLFWALSLVLAFLLYKTVERPFLKLREKF